MTEKTKLCYDANHVYREGYDQAVADYNENTAAAVGLFIEQCGHMAEENWLPSQVKQLEWLFGAVLHGENYADYAERSMNEETDS